MLLRGETTSIFVTELRSLMRIDIYETIQETQNHHTLCNENKTSNHTKLLDYRDEVALFEQAIGVLSFNTSISHRLRSAWTSSTTVTVCNVRQFMSYFIYHCPGRCILLTIYSLSLCDVRHSHWPCTRRYSTSLKRLHVEK